MRVALLAEGVDRNSLISTRFTFPRQSPSSRRAWIEIIPYADDTKHHRSPSSRRAWIEIFFVNVYVRVALVALLAEGVDRNCDMCRTEPYTWVALLAEGVDRNDEKTGLFENEKESRPPRGGRG